MPRELGLHPDQINLRVHDEEFHHFVSGTYDRCKKMDLQPDKVASFLKQLIDLSESVPLPQIPEYTDLLKFWTIISLPLVSFLAASIFVSPDYKDSLLYDALLVLSTLPAKGVLLRF